MCLWNSPFSNFPGPFCTCRRYVPYLLTSLIVLQALAIAFCNSIYWGCLDPALSSSTRQSLENSLAGVPVGLSGQEWAMEMRSGKGRPRLLFEDGIRYPHHSIPFGFSKGAYESVLQSYSLGMPAFALLLPSRHRSYPWGPLVKK
jgi:hypothetical protein